MFTPEGCVLHVTPQPQIASLGLWQAAASQDDYMVVLLVCFLLCIAIVLALLLLTRASKRREMEAERQRFLQEEMEETQKALQLYTSGISLESLPNLNDQVVGVILRTSERCCGLAHIALRLGTRTMTEYVGSSEGFSLRLTKNVSYRTSSYRGKPQTTVTEIAQDVGPLYVTNQRLVFAGAKEVVSVPLSKVADARAYEDRLIVLVENQSDAYTFRINEYRAPFLATVTKFMAQGAYTG